jgi:hypothetical protein
MNTPERTAIAEYLARSALKSVRATAPHLGAPFGLGDVTNARGQPVLCPAIVC